MRTRTRLAVLAPSLLAAHAAAFTDPLASKYIPWGKVSTQSYSPGIFTKALAVDFVGMGTPQIALLRDDKLNFLWTPNAHASAAVVANGVHDFCKLPMHAFLAGEGVASVGALGVYVHYFNGSAFVNNVVDGNSSALDARKIGAGDIDADGDTDLAVVLASGVDIRMYYCAGGTSYVAGPELTLTQEVRDLWIVRWGTSLAPRLAVHTGAGLGIYDPSLVSEATLRTSAPGPTIDAATPFTLPSGEQGIGWTTWLTSGATQQKLMMWRQSGSSNLGQVGPLGGETPLEPGVVSMAMNDATSDGYPDLMFGCASTKDVVYSRNLARTTGSPVVFDVSGSGLTPMFVTSSPAPNSAYRAIPVLADFNADRLTDVFVPVQNSPGSTTLLGPLDSQSPSFTGVANLPPIGGAWSSASGIATSPYPAANALRLKITDEWSSHSNATHLRVIVWRWPFPCAPAQLDNCTAADLPLDTVAVSNYYWPLDSGGVIPTATPCIDLGPYAGAGDDLSVFCFEVSLVQATLGPTNARVTQAWTVHSYGFAREYSASSPHQHGPIVRTEALPDAGAGTEMDVAFPNTAAPDIGIIIPLPRQPDFAPNATPSLGPPVVRSWIAEGV